jgi:antitoxin component of MazEF toxin-antitoxin module
MPNAKQEAVTMPLTKRLGPVGNSMGLTFDKPILRQVGWEEGTSVDLRVEGQSIILTRHRHERPARGAMKRRGRGRRPRTE